MGQFKMKDEAYFKVEISLKLSNQKRKIYNMGE